MFRFELVCASEQPSLALGQAGPGLLSPREERMLAGLAYLPRRRKWLLGRAAAKRLVRALSLPQQLAEADISVLNRPSGEPFVVIEGVGEWPRAISISHRRVVGLAAAPGDSTARIGADVETVEPRDPALVRQFFTDVEANLVAAAGGDRDLTVARIWSAKEAVLKLLGLGLRIDTRTVSVTLTGTPFPECPPGWQPIDIRLPLPMQWGEGRGEGPRQDPPLPAQWGEGRGEGPRLDDLRVVWRLEAGYVVTVAVARASL
jgi:phosphopantetheinyl transferase